MTTAFKVAVLNKSQLFCIIKKLNIDELICELASLFKHRHLFFKQIALRLLTNHFYRFTELTVKIF